VKKEGPKFDSAPSRIEPVPEGVKRPFWSVMIPTYNCAKYLRQTLESVLAQDPGPEHMQIEVVDDCSTKDDPEAVVAEVGKGRVTFYRKPKNEGATANFNTCIERSRGQLVHILHGDDYVSPGFYKRIEQSAASNPGCAAYFVRSFIVMEDNALDTITGRTQWLETPSNLPGTLLYENELRTPGVVVRRVFYERHGGFLPSLVHVADWEMWLRAITLGSAVVINEVLASYRFFAGNDTARLARTAENLKDYLRLSEILVSTQPDFDKERFAGKIAWTARWQAKKFKELGIPEAERANLEILRVVKLPFRAHLHRVLGRVRQIFS